MFQLASVPVLSDVVVTFLSSIVVLSSTGNFWVLTLLHSVSDVLGVFCFRLYERVVMDGEANILGFEKRDCGLF
jgi:hypothetical protein